MKVLVIGSGAREHALSWKLRQSPGVSEVIAAPGNAGIAEVARCEAVSAEDVSGLVALAKREDVGLVVVGPEAPLTLGVVDAMVAEGIPTFGPSRAAARLEGSKVFSKEIMAECGIPTAGFRVFEDASAALEYVEDEDRPLVIKADGLCAGKGVVVAGNVEEAKEAIHSMMIERVFGEAGARVVIEDCLVGPEVSYHVVCDGQRIVALASAQDHKRLGDGDSGPNTGGMGAYSPPPFVTPEMEREIDERVVVPLLAAMKSRGAPFRGVLFVGLMIVDGRPQVLEFNVRFGDPETEVLMARWDGDVLPLLLGAANGDLSGVTPKWAAPAALSVVMAAAGYPGSPKKGDVITGLTEANAVEGAVVFHAGTKREGEAVKTNGGRVLAVTATGATVDEAAELAYRAVSAVKWEGAQYRKDIGWQARRR